MTWYSEQERFHIDKSNFLNMSCSILFLFIFRLLFLDVIIEYWILNFEHVFLQHNLLQSMEVSVFQRCLSAFFFSPIPGIVNPSFSHLSSNIQFPISLFNFIWTLTCPSSLYIFYSFEKQLTSHRVDHSICNWFWDHTISQPDSFKVVILIITFF
jgi:hypothetical protein